MNQEYRADIDGLRAIAVLLVVAFHAFPQSVPGGYIGVDVFFVISGYLITGLILDLQKADRFSIKQFYVRRARRILPALSVVVTASLVVGWVALFPVDYKRLGLHAVVSTLFIPNLVYWSEAGYFDQSALAKPLLHLWSLGVEEQFYLVWPLLLLLLRRRKMRATATLCIISAASLIYSSVTVFYDPVAAFYSPLSRLWELGAGGILASHCIKVRHSEFASALGLALVCAAAFMLTDKSIFPGLLAIIPVAGTALVIIGHSRILNGRLLVAIGLISYPLYLWHWPLLSFAHTLDLHTELAKAVIVAISILLAALTTHYVENPIRFGSLRPRGVAISAAATLATAIGAVTIYCQNGFIGFYPPEIQRIVAAEAYRIPAAARMPQCWTGGDASFSSYEPECRVGKILVWGDSFSAMLATGLPRPYAQFSRSSCMPLLIEGSDQLASRFQGREVNYNRCAENNEATVEEILKLKPERVILFGVWAHWSDNWQSDQVFNAPLRSTLHKLRQGIDDVVLLGPSPLWGPSLPEDVFRYWFKNRVLPDRLKLPNEEGYRATDKVMSDIAASEHVHFISIFDSLCNSDGCLAHTPRSQSELLAWDYGHFTVEGARYVVQALHLDRLGADHPGGGT